MRKIILVIVTILVVFLAIAYFLGHKSKTEVETGAYYKAQTILCDEEAKLFSDISENYSDYLSYKKSESDFMEDVKKNINKYNDLEDQSKSIKDTFNVKVGSGTSGEKAIESLDKLRTSIGELLYNTTDKSNKPLPRDEIFKKLYDTKQKVKELLEDFKFNIEAI